MGLAKYFEERIERFLSDTDEIRRDLNNQKSIYGPEIIEQKAYSIHRSMRNLCDELLSIVTSPENQNALALEELSKEAELSNETHQRSTKEQNARIAQLERQLRIFEAILDEKDGVISELKLENSGLQNVVSERDKKIANIHTYYKERMNALTGKETPSEAPEVAPTKEPAPKELSFNELMEQAAKRARIEDKRQ